MPIRIYTNVLLTVLACLQLEIYAQQPSCSIVPFQALIVNGDVNKKGASVNVGDFFGERDEISLGANGYLVLINCAGEATEFRGTQLVALGALSRPTSNSFPERRVDFSKIHSVDPLVPPTSTLSPSEITFFYPFLPFANRGLFEVNPASPLCMEWVALSTIGKKVIHRVNVRNVYDDLLYSDTTSRCSFEISKQRVGNVKEILLEVYDATSTKRPSIMHGFRLVNNSNLFLRCGPRTAIDDLMAGFALESQRVNDGARMYYQQARKKSDGNIAIRNVLDVCDQRLNK